MRMRPVRTVYIKAKRSYFPRFGLGKLDFAGTGIKAGDVLEVRKFAGKIILEKVEKQGI